MEILTVIDNIPIKRNFIDNLPCNINIKELAKQKRKAGVLTEVLFWQHVHKQKFHGLDFDRQRIIGDFIVDFYVKTLGLVIEIDGGSHIGRHFEDEQRQAFIESFGIKFYRITDALVLDNIEYAMLGLTNFIKQHFALK
jgi:very-short-patch-repair endonuclease